MKLTPDIVLIKPGSQRLIYGALSDFDLTAIEPPLWAAIIAGFLRGLNYRVEILDAEAEEMGPAATADAVRNMSPMLAVIMVSGTNPSASTMNMPAAGEIARKIRETAPRTGIGMAGLHPTAIPKQTMETEAIDFLIQGEGFATFPGLIDALRQNVLPSGLPGLWFRKDGNIIESRLPPLLRDLDSLPRPAWDMLPMDRYRAHNWHCFDTIDRRAPYAVLYTSLGCPFKCSFCCINSLFGKNVIRYRSVESVVSEVDFLVRTYGVRNIKLMDEMFAMNEKRVIRLCNMLVERNYDLNIWAYARVDTVTPLMIKKMKQAGINWLAYGFESGNQRAMDSVAKGFSAGKIMDIVTMTREQDIHICSNFIFGLPEDDYESMNDTLSLMMAINAEWANIYCAMAYPGSQLYSLAKQNEWKLPDNWGGYSQYARDSQPLATRYLSGGQVLSFRDYAFDAYYKSPRYLNMIRQTFGNAAMDHIRNMTETRLLRNHAEI